MITSTKLNQRKESAPGSRSGKQTASRCHWCPRRSWRSSDPSSLSPLRHPAETRQHGGVGSVPCFWLSAQTALCVSLAWKHAQHTSHVDMKPTGEMCTARRSVRPMFHNFQKHKGSEDNYSNTTTLHRISEASNIHELFTFFPSNARAWICNNTAASDVAAFMCFFPQTCKLSVALRRRQCSSCIVWVIKGTASLLLLWLQLLFSISICIVWAII